MLDDLQWLQFGALLLSGGAIAGSATAFLARSIARVDIKLDGLRREVDQLSHRIDRLEDRVHRESKN